MLQELWIENVALVERLRVRFGNGLNALTGETGAGKSLVVAALDLVLGARASADIVRSGAGKAEIVARFECAGDPPPAAADAFEDGALVLRRVVTASGKSRAYVNERPSTVGRLRELGAALADLHGQHEQQNLLREETHTAYLDGFAGAEEIRAAYGEAYREHARAVEARRRFVESAKRSAEEQIWLRHQLQELEAAGLEPGCEDAWERERRVAAGAGRLSEAVGHAREILGDQSEGLTGALARVAGRLAEAARLDPDLDALARQIDQASVIVEEADRDLARYLDRLDTDPERLEELEARLAALARLKRTHLADEAGLIAKREALRESLDAAEDASGALERIEEQVTQATSHLVDTARVLSETRTKAAVRLGRGVSRELTGLGMSGARFEVALDRPGGGVSVAAGRGPYGPSGAETARFVLAANPGEPSGPLSRVASGGEASRVMLALKNVFRATDPVPLAIFDEVDSGIGGLVAEAVGERLAAIAAGRQVLVVTHLAVIAGRATHHLKLEKATAGGRTTVSVSEIRGAAREEELSRMLAGSAGGESARRTARRILRGSGAPRP